MGNWDKESVDKVCSKGFKLEEFVWFVMDCLGIS